MPSDEEQRVVLFNTAAEKMFGCAASEAMGAAIERFILPRFRSEHRAHIRRYGQTGVTNRSMGTLGALRASRTNGAEFPIEASISQVEADANKFFTVTIRGIRDSRPAHESVRESE